MKLREEMLDWEDVKKRRVVFLAFIDRVQLLYANDFIISRRDGVEREESLPNLEIIVSGRNE